MKKIISFLILGLIIVGVVYFFINRNQENPNLPQTTKTETSLANPASVYCIENGGNLEIRKDQTGFCKLKDGSECEEWAYFRKECGVGSEDIVKTFISLINEHRVAEAVGMLDSSVVPDDSTKQAWGVQFNSFQSLALLNIEKPTVEGIDEIYKVTLNAKMKPESANAAIPNYGFNDGENIRWISVTKNNNLYKIKGIATGP